MDPRHSSAPKAFYKPLATRTLVLIIYLFTSLALLGLTEYACQQIPQHAGLGSFSNVVNGTVGALRQRANDGIGNTSFFQERDAQLHKRSSTTRTSTDAHETATQTANGGYLSIGGSTTVISSPTTSTPGIRTISFHVPLTGYLPLGSSTSDDSLSSSSTTSEKPISTIIGTFTAVGGYVSLTPPRPTDGYLSPGGGAATATPQVPTTVQTTAVGTPNMGYLTVSSGAQVTAAYTEFVVPTALSGYLSMTTADAVLTSIAVTKLSTSFSTSTKLDGEIVVLASTSTIITTEAVWTTLSAVHPIATTVNTTGTYILMSDGSSRIPPQIILQQYITVAFVPMMLALVLTLPWRIIDKTIREMEPFYQLQHSHGATAEKSLLLDYPTSMLISMPLKSLFRRHYFVFLSSIISLALLIVAPLASEVLFVSLSGICVANVSGHCHATWGVYPVLARTIEGILAFVTLLLLFMILLDFRRKSGVFANPLSIAGLGALFQNSDIQQEFASLDSTLNNSALKDILSGRVYKLAMMTNWDGSSSYGIAPWTGDLDGVYSSYGDKRGNYDRVDVTDLPHKDIVQHSLDQYSQKRSRMAGFKQKLLYVSAFLLIAGILTVISYYHWTSGDTGFENFMDSQGFGVKFLMAALGVVVKLSWSNIDEDLRRLEPYRRLLRGSAKARDSILVETYMSPLSSLIPSLRNKHFLVFTVSLIAVLSELLPITFANIPFSAGQVKEAYTICNFLATAILILMVIALSVLIFRPTHDLQLLPRKPTMVASVLLYLATQPSHYGGMLDSLAGLEMMPASEMHKRVAGMGRLYSLGWVAGGELRIDEDGRT